MRYLLNGSTDPQYNMAFDEFALERLALDEPLFYLWRNAPSVIIGLNQNPYAEVDLEYLRDNGIKLARRVTGGGAVYHDLQNLNYTIVGKSGDLDKDYPDYLHFMLNALRSLGVPAELSGRNDIMVQGRKCSGYAKRVWKDRLMVHGTLMFDVDLSVLGRALNVPGSKLSASGIASVHSKVANLKDYLPQFADVLMLKDALQVILAEGDEELGLEAGELAAIEAIADGKFRSWEWIYGRSPSASFKKVGKFSCGTVEACFDIVHGNIHGLCFSGDFIGNQAVDGLCNRLDGLRFDADTLRQAVEKEPVGSYFDGMDADRFVEFLMSDNLLP